MTNPLKWWFSRKPYTPSFLKHVEPVVVSQELEEAVKKSAARSDIRVIQSRNLALSVVSLHGELLKIIEGNRT